MVMGFAARVVMMLVARFKALGFLEWAGIASLIDTVLTYNVKKEMFAVVVEFAAKGAGLALDPEDPFSDASLSNAVSERVGFTVRTLKDKESIKQDLEGYALILIEAKTGYRLSSLSNIAALRSDLERVGMQRLSESVGIPLAIPEGGQLDVDAVRAQVMAWAKPQLIEKLNEEAGFNVAEIITAGGIDAVASDMNSRLSEIGSKQSVTARQIALRVSEKMAVGAVADFGRVAVGLEKKNRKRELNRAAQAKFRRAHGNRAQYVPLGFVAHVDPLEGPPVTP